MNIEIKWIIFSILYLIFCGFVARFCATNSDVERRERLNRKRSE